MSSSEEKVRCSQAIVILSNAPVQEDALAALRTRLKLKNDSMAIFPFSNAPASLWRPLFEDEHFPGWRSERKIPSTGQSRQDLEQQQVQNKLKQIGLAVINSHETHGHSPSNLLAEDGTPLLSWRVAILPFLEEEALDKEFNLKESWDSETNVKLLERMPAVFAADGTLETQTNLLAPEGENVVIGDKTVKVAQIVEGTTNTILVVTPNSFIEWSRPLDFDFNPEDPESLRSEKRVVGDLALFADGSVKNITEIDSATLLQMFFYNDLKP